MVAVFSIAFLQSFRECFAVGVDECRFMLLADYESYIKCQETVSQTYAVSFIHASNSMIQL